MLTWIFLALGIICTVLFLIKRDGNSSLSALMLKTCSSMMFVITAAVSLYYTKGDIRYGILIVIGLVFGLLGDIWLDLKWIYKEEIRYYLYGGFIFFMLGHFSFIPAVIIANHLQPAQVAQCLIMPVLVAVGVQLAAKPMKLDMTGYRAICSVYGAFVALTLSTSVTAAFANQGGFSQTLMAIGAAAFFASDLILCSTYFGKDKTGKGYVVVNHLLYYIGQFSIAVSVFFLTKAD